MRDKNLLPLPRDIFVNHHTKQVEALPADMAHLFDALMRVLLRRLVATLLDHISPEKNFAIPTLDFDFSEVLTRRVRGSFKSKEFYAGIDSEILCVDRAVGIEAGRDAIL